MMKHTGRSGKPGVRLGLIVFRRLMHLAAYLRPLTSMGRSFYAEDIQGIAHDDAHWIFTKALTAS